MEKAVRFLQANHLLCIAHTLQLAINCGLKESGVTNTLAKCRKIVGYYKHPTQQKEQLLSVQKELDASRKQTLLVNDLILHYNYDSMTVSCRYDLQFDLMPATSVPVEQLFLSAGELI